MLLNLANKMSLSKNFPFFIPLFFIRQDGRISIYEEQKKRYENKKMVNHAMELLKMKKKKRSKKKKKDVENGQKT